jgi:hypothetical protein
MTPEDGFGADSSKASGRSYCKVCDRRRGRAYYDAHRDELYARRQAEHDAAREAALEALKVEHRKRVAETARIHAAHVRSQKELLRSLGVPDVSPEGINARSAPGRGMR